MLSSPGPRQLAYAPTPHSYMPNSALQATISLDEVYAPIFACDCSSTILSRYRK